jgi:uncharacterized protein YggE
MRFSRQALVTATLLLAAHIPANLSIAAELEKLTERLVNVSASGSIVVVPDIAYVSIGVRTEASTMREALNRNKAIMAKLIDGLRSFGIAANDMQTSSFNVSSQYMTGKDGRSSTMIHTVTNQVRATVRELNRLGDVLDQSVTLGANQIHGITLAVSDAEKLKDDARVLAMKNAQRQAQLYAAAAGAELGPVLRVAEGGLFDDTSLFQVSKFSGGHTSSVPVEVGAQTLAVTVQVVYALR